MRQTGATAYVIFDGEEIIDASGARIPPSELKNDGETPVVSYKLLLEGKPDRFIAFAFADRNMLEIARPRLDQATQILNSVCKASALRTDYVRMAERLADLDTRVLDTKIAERARGFVGDHARPDPIEDIARHVAFVLRPTPVRQTITQLLDHLQKEMEARQVASQAKAILQNSHGMSEEAAHQYLQRASRKTRRPLRDIAAAVVERFAVTRS